MCTNSGFLKQVYVDGELVYNWIMNFLQTNQSLSMQCLPGPCRKPCGLAHSPSPRSQLFLAAVAPGSEGSLHHLKGLEHLESAHL